MAAISKIEFVINGKKITSFSSFTEKGVKYGEDVPLVEGSVYVELNRQYGFELEYVIPKEGDEVDFTETIETPANVIIYYAKARKRTYRGVQILEEGDAKATGKDAMTKTISFKASDRDPK